MKLFILSSSVVNEIGFLLCGEVIGTVALKREGPELTLNSSQT